MEQENTPETPVEVLQRVLGHVINTKAWGAAKAESYAESTDEAVQALVAQVRAATAE